MTEPIESHVGDCRTTTSESRSTDRAPLDPESRYADLMNLCAEGICEIVSAREEIGADQRIVAVVAIEALKRVAELATQHYERPELVPATLLPPDYRLGSVIGADIRDNTFIKTSTKEYHGHS